MILVVTFVLHLFVVVVVVVVYCCLCCGSSLILLVSGTVSEPGGLGISIDHPDQRLAQVTRN